MVVLSLSSLNKKNIFFLALRSFQLLMLGFFLISPLQRLLSAVPSFSNPKSICSYHVVSAVLQRYCTLYGY